MWSLILLRITLMCDTLIYVEVILVEYQNITLSLPKDVLLKVKHIAVEKRTSVSGLLARTLEDIVKKEDSYRKARERHTAILNNVSDLGTNGSIRWSRGDIHER